MSLGKQIKVMTSRGGLRAQLLRGGAGSLVLRFANVGLSLGAAVVLARMLGVENFGIYSYVFALVSLLAVPAKFGLPGLVVRETAKAETTEKWGLMRGIWRWASLSATALSLVLAMAGGFFAWLFADHFTTVQLVTFAWGLAFVPLLALGSLCGAGLRGLRKVIQGQLHDQVVRPVLLIVFVLVAGTFASQGVLGAEQAMALNVLATAIAFAVGAVLLQRARPTQLAAQSQPQYQIRAWFSSVLPFALIGGMQIVNMQIDIIMLGLFGTAHEVGLYKVAVRGAALVLIGLVAIRQVTSPYFARFYANREMDKLQRTATIVSRAALVMAAPAAIVFIFFGSPIIRVVFGEDYVDAYSPLATLAVFRLVGMGVGPVGSLLNMSGHERDTLKVMSVSAGCNIVLNAVLIPIYGMNGAAIATGTTFIGYRLVMWWLVRIRVGVDVSVLGKSPKIAV